jgi:hypothetical protein
MVSISILLILGAILAIIFVGRIYEYILQKFRNRERNEIASNQS